MSIRDAANAAVDAEKARIKAEQKANWNRHAQEAVAITEALLGLNGKCTRAHNTDPGGKESGLDGWGDGATVGLADENEAFYVKVGYEVTFERTWGNESRKVVGSPYLMLVASDGKPLYGPDEYDVWHGDKQENRIKSLADLGRALTAFDAWYAKQEAALNERKARA